jgi:hypothetical protein
MVKTANLREVLEYEGYKKQGKCFFKQLQKEATIIMIYWKKCCGNTEEKLYFKLVVNHNGKNRLEEKVPLHGVSLLPE